MKSLPNILSASRLVFAPVMVLVAATTHSQPWFLGLFGAALLTDALDGFLARRLRSESDLGRRLDSWGDYAIITAVVAGLALLWPDDLQREWRWIATGIAAFFVSAFYGLVRWGRLPGYHTWLAKGLAVAFPLSLLCLVEGWSAVPFRTVVGLQVVGAVEEVAIALLLPGYTGEMASVFHALRRRRESRATTTAGSQKT
jgi:phosphatidylglycerophosphate synthase